MWSSGTQWKSSDFYCVLNRKKKITLNLCHSFHIEVPYVSFEVISGFYTYDVPLEEVEEKGREASQAFSLLTQ